MSTARALTLLLVCATSTLAQDDPYTPLEKSSSWKERAQAAQRLGQRRDAGAAPALIRRLEQDDNAIVRASAAWALGQIHHTTGRSLAALATAVHDQDAKVQKQAREAILRWRRGEAPATLDGATVPALIKALTVKDDRLRSGLVSLLAWLKATQAEPHMVHLLDKTPWSTQLSILRALKQLPATKPTTFKRIAKLCFDGTNALVRLKAAKLLGASSRPQAEKTAREALAKLGSDDPKQQAIGARCLGGLGVLLDQVLPAFETALRKTEETQLSLAVSAALRALGRRAKPLGKTVRSLIEFNHKRRQTWLGVLAVIDPTHPKSKPILLRALKDPTFQVTVIRGLQEAGERAKPYVPALISVLSSSPKPTSRMMTTFALATIDPSNPKVRQALRDAEGDSDQHVRSSARRALSQALKPKQ